MFQLMHELFEAPDTSSGGPSAEMSKEDIIEFLGEDDEKEEPISLKEEKTDDKEIPKITEEKDDEVEEEKEEEPITEEKLELVTPSSRKEILEKYPKLFKDFPYLEKAMYREQQYTDILPTINDAKNAIIAKDTLDKVERDLLSGNTENILKAAKNENPQAFNRIVDNYLTTLSKVDEKAHHHVIGNVIKHTIITMVNESRRSNNEILQNAAQILNQFVFGSSDFVPPQRLSNDQQPNTEETRLRDERNAFTKQRFDIANNDVSARVNNAFKSTIDANIDPKQSMSDYVRRNAAREAHESLEKLINTDSRFRQQIDRLWESALRDNFSKEATDKIRAAFLSKAKTILPSVIRNARNEALRGTGKRVSDRNEEDTTVKKGRNTEMPNSNNNGKIPQGMTTLEFLMKD